MSDFYNEYPYTDFHELNLDWVIKRVKQLTEDWLATQQEWNNTEEQWQQLYDYVHDYFANLDVQDEINNKINQMILDGTFMTIVTPTINQTVVDATTTWLAAHITQPTTPAIDNTLTIAGAAADAKAAGDAIAAISDQLTYLGLVSDGDCDSFVNASIATVVNTGTTANRPVAGFGGVIFTFGGVKAALSNRVQLAVSLADNICYVRYATGSSTWTTWSEITEQLKTYGTTGSFDLNNARANSVVCVYGSGISNVPFTGFSGTVLTFGSLSNDVTNTIQLAMNRYNKVYVRFRYSSWGSWFDLSGQFLNLGYITNQNADDLALNSIMSGSVTTATPDDSATFYGNILTFSGTPEDTRQHITQLGQHTSEGNLYTRSKYAAWNKWHKIPFEDEIVVDNRAFAAMGDFVACGDSLTKSISYKTGLISEDVTSWAEYIAKDCLNANATVYAQGGIDTGQYLSSTLFTDACAHVGDAAFIFLGTNDDNHGVDAATFKTNYQNIVDGLKTNHKFVICISLCACHTGNPETYNPSIIDICNNTARTFFCDIRPYNDLLAKYNNTAGHFSSFGYAVMAGIIEMALNKTMQAVWFQYDHDFL